MPFTSSLRPTDLLDRYSIVWTARETASIKTAPTNPNNPPVNPPLFNVLAPLFNSARSIQISQYDTQKESGYEWLFNYKAVLNTRVQTITTKLNNALNSDLEGLFSAYPGDTNLYTNPDTNVTTTEPQPSADEWAWLYGANGVNWSVPPRRNGAPGSGTAPDWAGKATFNGQPVPLSPLVVNSAGNPGSFATFGTQVIQSGGTVQGTSTGTVVFHDGVTAGSTRTSKYWAAYLELFNNSEYSDVWRYGLLDKVVITGTAAAGNGSQLQASLTLRMPDILKLQYSAATPLRPGDPYPGQTNLPTPSTVSLPGGGSTANNDQAYNENWAVPARPRSGTDQGHGFIQNKFTAFWHS